MKKALILLLCALLLPLSACKRESPPEPEEILGEIVTVDGLQQNLLRYITDAYYQDGNIYYTIVNETTQPLGIGGDKPTMEKLVDGEWVEFSLYSSIRGPYSLFPGNYQITRSFRVDRNQDLMPGKYRLTIGDPAGRKTRADGATVLEWDESKVYVVGYLTISEEEAPPVDPDMHGLHFYRYHDKVTMTVESYPDPHPLYRLQYRFINDSEKPLVVCLTTLTESHYSPEHKRYEEKSGEYETAFFGSLRCTEGADKLTVPPGAEVTRLFEFDESGEPADLYELTDGKYFFLFPCYFEGEAETAFTVFVRFTVENGVITEQKTALP